MRKSSLRLALVMAVAVAGLSAPARANIDTTGIDAGGVWPFGAPNTATYGQTFTAGAADTNLSSFSLFLNGREDGEGPLDLRGYLATWTGDRIGALLYSSPVVTMNAAGDFQEFAFSTGGLATIPGQQYVAFLSVSDLPVQDSSLFFMPLSDNRLPGEFVYQNNGNAFSDLYNAEWTTNYNNGVDVWFKADFGTPVPEPASWAMMIAGFGLVGGALRRGPASARSDGAFPQKA